MSRISAPRAGARSQPTLDPMPNMLAILSLSPAALEGYLALERAMGQCGISPETRARIALAVAEVNGCAYCLSAAVYKARTRLKLDDAEITANRNGASNDLKADAAVRFAHEVALRCGRVSDAALAAFKAAGYGEANAIEIAVLVALNTLTNTVNNLAMTEIDFPAVAVRRAARGWRLLWPT